MARITKPGLNYFPLDVDFLNDRKVRKIMHKHGSLAASALIAIYSSIYKDKGYYMQWDEDICFDMSEITLIDMKDLELIVAAAMEAELFDKKLFEEHRIITSQAIQNQYKLCTNKRKSTEIEERYRLIDSDVSDAESTVEPDSCVQQCRFSGVNDAELPLNVAGMQQSKVKERKEKKTSSLPFSKNGEGKAEKEKAERRDIIPDYCFNTATHNYSGLLERLKTIGVKDDDEIAAIMKLSDYGKIGAKVWKIIAYGRWPPGNAIKLPGRYIIAMLKKS